MSSLGVDGVTLRSDDGFGNLDPENTIIESSSDVIIFNTISFSPSTIVEGFTIRVAGNASGFYINSDSGGGNPISPTIRGNRITTAGTASINGIQVFSGFMTSTEPIIENNKIFGDFTVGIEIGGGGGIVKPRIENNYIVDASTDGISILSQASSDTLYLKNNTVKSSGTNGVAIAFNANLVAAPILSHNLIKDNSNDGFYLITSGSGMAAPNFLNNTIMGNTGNGINLDGLGGGGINADLGGGGNSPGLNTFQNNGAYELENRTYTGISAQHNWWTNNPPIENTDYINTGSGATVDASFPNSDVLSFTLSNTTGDEAGGNSITITAAANTYFVDKVGWSDSTTDRYRIEVKFGSAMASNVVVDPSNDSLTATVPAGTGAVSVTVTNPAGQTGTASEDYTYISSNAAPTAPVLLYPTDGTTDVSITPTFAWKKSTDIDGDTITYDIYVCEDQSFTGIDCDGILVTMAWSQIVRYAGMGGFAGGGFLFLLFISFGIRKLKEKIKLILAGLLISALLITACARSDSGGSDETPIIDETISTYTLGTALNSGTQFYWKVVAKDGQGGETPSETWSFTTE